MKTNSNFKIFLQVAAALFYLNTLIFGLLPLSIQAQTLPATTQTTAQRCAAFKAQFNLTSNGGANISNGVPIYCSATTVITIELQAAFAIAGVIVILFLVYGGFIYMTSAGNDEQTEKAKKILINAVLGLVVIIMATAIVTIVSGLLSGGS